MKHARLPVVAAIPNYNMSEALKVLLPQLVAQDYDAVYVLDDGSTDDSERIVAGFPRVTFVKAVRRTYAGGARNRIMGQLKATSLIHFLDADVTLRTLNMPEKIRRLGIDDSTGFVGGLAVTPTGQQSLWNYGAPMWLGSSLAANGMQLLERLDGLFDHKLKLGLLYQLIGQGRRPNPKRRDRRRRVFWVLEANFVIRSDTFERLGGFDASIKEHDIQPLAYKARQAGLVSWFDPSFVVVQHDDIKVRTYRRSFEKYRTEWYVIKKYSRLLGWLFPFVR